MKNGGDGLELAYKNWMFAFLPNSVQGHTIGTLKLATIGLLSLWKLANMTGKCQHGNKKT